jgi:diguanylate cyclase (GGDEF)-like protein/PAS domain S-box-containing protein
VARRPWKNFIRTGHDKEFHGFIGFSDSLQIPSKTLLVDQVVFSVYTGMRFDDRRPMADDKNIKNDPGDLETDFYKNILDNLYEGVYFCSWERKISYWNKAAEKLTGYKAEDIVGQHCWDNILMHTNNKGENLCKNENCPAVRAMKEQRLVEEEVFLKHKDGYRLPVITRISPMKDSTGKVIGAVEIFSDNSNKISAFMQIEKLEQLAFIDALTGVGNRRYTEIKINTKLEEMNRYSWANQFGLLFIDIDHFKEVNDQYGHDAGDKVLKVVTKTFMNNLREEDFVGRWGGEEFILLIANVEKKDLYTIAEKIRGLIEHSHIPLPEKEITVTVSIGATTAKRDDDIDSVIKRADRLMYYSKGEGRNNVTIG